MPRFLSSMLVSFLNRFRALPSCHFVAASFLHSIAPDLIHASYCHMRSTFLVSRCTSLHYGCPWWKLILGATPRSSNQSQEPPLEDLPRGLLK
ncbi:hypothetical protein VNO77_03214 [Canavalia gladiata]|uniref:Uncharacterized protein n=1 Tax=Canavalia gladiata TaxID=3824 RepID=A0AAN9MZA1_CANGL